MGKKDLQLVLKLPTTIVSPWPHDQQHPHGHVIPATLRQAKAMGETALLNNPLNLLQLQLFTE